MITKEMKSGAMTQAVSPLQKGMNSNLFGKLKMADTLRLQIKGSKGGWLNLILTVMKYGIDPYLIIT